MLKRLPRYKLSLDKTVFLPTATKYPTRLIVDNGEG